MNISNTGKNWDQTIWKFSLIFLTAVYGSPTYFVNYGQKSFITLVPGERKWRQKEFIDAINSLRKADRGQWDQMIWKKLPNFLKSSQNSCQTK